MKVDPRLTCVTFKTSGLMELCSQKEPDGSGEQQILCVAIAASGAHLLLGGRKESVSC